MRRYLVAALAAGQAACASAEPAPAPAPAPTQAQQVVPCPPEQQPLLTMPEIRSANGKLRGTVKLIDGVRTLWGAGSDTRCATQNLRYLSGSDASNPQPWPVSTEPIPGPTLRARLGDLVELSFFNQINLNNFAGTLDRGAVGTQSSCDQFTTSASKDSSSTSPAGGDNMPNCLHGSSTSNLHFHGTHTTPSTTGDNILLFVRPAQRTTSGLLPSEAQANSAFSQFFAQCEQSGPPKLWTQMPGQWQQVQQSALQNYDSTAVYQGQRGTLPVSMQLWPYNQAQIAQGLWPQYQIGAYPYCFPLPAYNPATMKMGQSPGTHWYHAHKHGSTALNVANGLTGAFIIQGQYDDDLRRYYGQGLVERILMIQQLGAAPFPLTNPNTGGPNSEPRPSLSVNGRRNPVVTMRPGEVQFWRIINGSFRDAVQFVYTQAQAAPACRSTTSIPPVQWRQIAQDGVQFNVQNYNEVGSPNSAFNLAPANRADLLVKAPTQPGNYNVCVVRNSALFVSANVGLPDSATVLLTITVAGSAVSMDFIPNAQFPAFPSFLSDVQENEIRVRRTLTFGAGNSTINDSTFRDGRIDQTMTLNTAEEWTVQNVASNKSHPFHIHINPFQITALFEPNAPEARDPNNPCYVNLRDTTTYKPCASRQPAAPWVWWDTFAIPSARVTKIDSICTTLAACPQQMQKFVTCSSGCSITIPGWFRMRTRFVDFAGDYVLHCHILIHEDRGMMQLIEVRPGTTPYRHHEEDMAFSMSGSNSFNAMTTFLLSWPRKVTVPLLPDPSSVIW